MHKWIMYFLNQNIKNESGVVLYTLFFYLLFSQNELVLSMYISISIHGTTPIFSSITLSLMNMKWFQLFEYNK